MLYRKDGFDAGKLHPDGYGASVVAAAHGRSGVVKALLAKGTVSADARTLDDLGNERKPTRIAALCSLRSILSGGSAMWYTRNTLLPCSLSRGATALHFGKLQTIRKSNESSCTVAARMVWTRSVVANTF